MSRVLSFSVHPEDTENKQLIARIKAHCERNGVTFSYIVLKALAKYAEEVLWKTK